METTARVLDALAAEVRAARDRYAAEHPDRMQGHRMGRTDMAAEFLAEITAGLYCAAAFVRDEYVTPLPTPVAEGAAGPPAEGAEACSPPTAPNGPCAPRARLPCPSACRPASPLSSASGAASSEPCSTASSSPAPDS